MTLQSKQAAKNERAQSLCPPTRTLGRFSKRLNGALLLSAVLLCCACDDKKEPSEKSTKVASTEGSPATNGSPASRSGGSARSLVTTHSLVDMGDRCTLNEQGLVIDLGSSAAEAREGFQLQTEAPPQFLQHQGNHYRRLDQMNQDFSFWSLKEQDAVLFEALVHGGDSERLAAYVDGERLGAAQLKPGQTRVVKIHKKDFKLAPGRHRLTLSLSRPKGGVPQGDVAWVRLGPNHEKANNYPATREQIFSEVSLGEERQRGIVVKNNATVRCPLWLSEKTQLHMKVGIWGAGSAEGEVAVIDSKGNEFVVAKFEREKDDKRDYESLEADLSRFASQMVELEFRAHSRTDTPRVVFGNPILSSKNADPQKPPRARRAIVILLSSLAKRHTPPQAANNGLPIFNQLAQAGTSFPQYRVSTSSSTALVASLLTGLAPFEHLLADPKQALAPEVASLAGSVETAGGRSSFFSGVPTSFSDFGFDRGFELFSNTRPQEDLAATQPLRLASEWLKNTLDQEAPVLSIVHLRGAHPPFDISKDKARALPPAEYGGNLTPRRAAIQFATIRDRRSSNQNMNEEDWVRWAAMEKAALERQNQALSDFIKWLRDLEIYDDSLIIVAGDVGSGSPPEIPYNEEAPLTEDYLSVPLLIKFPRSYLSGKSVQGVFAPRDLTRTISDALSLDFQPPRSDAINLGESAATRLARTRPHVAYRDGEYSMRLGSTLLRGKDGSSPSLCFFEIDPACQEDRSAQQIAISRSLWLTTYSLLSPALTRATKTIDLEQSDDFKNSLIVWGITP